MSVSHLLNQTVQIRTLHSTDYTGDPSYNTAVEYPAKISYKKRRILTGTGVERSSYARVTVEVEVGDADLIVLPDGTERVPLQATPVYDGTGAFHHCRIDI